MVQAWVLQGVVLHEYLKEFAHPDYYLVPLLQLQKLEHFLTFLMRLVPDVLRVLSAFPCPLGMVSGDLLVAMSRVPQQHWKPRFDEHT